MPKAKKKSEELDFVSIASHQLRTPLTLMKGYLSMILEGEFGRIQETKLKAALKIVYQANGRLLELVDNLLEMSRLENGRLSLYRQPVDIAACVAEIIGELKPKASAKGLMLALKKNGRIPAANADELMLRQVVVNLVDNALKFTLKGSVTVLLEASARNIKMIVRDTGPGMDAKNLRRLFKKFARFDVKHSAEEGFGLGLYIAALIIKAHKGTIRAEKNKNGGLDVICTVPAVR